MKRIVLFEARMESELSALVRRHGGQPVCVPAMREVERDCGAEVDRACAALAREGAVVVLTTGVGLERVLRVGDEGDGSGALRERLARAVVVCRGPKPVAVLKREKLPVHVRAPAPHTAKELTAALAGIDVAGRDVVVVHDGGGNAALAEALASRGARVHDVRPYEWALPEDMGALRDASRAIAEARVDAAAFTTQVQARHLFEASDACGVRGAMIHAMRDRVVVAAVGPTCARALRDLGVEPHVVPEQAKMGPMVAALMERLA